MISKLENDYTVYAYDFSEYETPLVGQGMLSRVLASVSPTPNAPAGDSDGMVTGRVCKNIMGLFQSGGIKETLEVKLKLVPVPTRSKREYLQCIAAYRDLGIDMPEGFVPDMWNQFLQAIPDAGILREGSSGQNASRANIGGLEQLHNMLTPKFGPEDDVYSNAPGSSRPASPTPSQRSMSNYAAGYSQSRPASRASFLQQEQSALDDMGFEDGPAPKRARLQQVDYHGRPSFGMKANSLQAHVSTSASIRHFRPSAVGGTSAGNDMIPRAPTPRAGEKRGGRPAIPRAGSSLRRESTGAMSPYSLPEPEFARTDSGVNSLGYDDDRSSRNGSPTSNYPSSPPEYTSVDPPSSPMLPELPQTLDSGFQSDLPGPPDMLPPPEKMNNNPNVQRKARGEFAWTHVQPGPQDRLPTQSFSQFDPLSQKSAMASAGWNQPPTSPTVKAVRPANQRGGRAPSKAPSASDAVRQTSTTPGPFDATSPSMLNPVPSIETSVPPTPIDHLEIPRSVANASMLPPTEDRGGPVQSLGTSPPAWMDQSKRDSSLPRIAPAPGSIASAGPGPASRNYDIEERLTKQMPGKKTGRPPKRALTKSQSWVAEPSSDVESDSGLGAVAAENKKSRSGRGSGLVRSNSINHQLQTALATGAPVRFCSNCGDIKTPTWRPYWLKVFEGSGSDVILGKSTGIHMVEPVERNEQGATSKHRVYKQYGHLLPDEKKDGSYEQTYFCNRESVLQDSFNAY